MREVADQLTSNILGRGEKIGDVRLDFGYELCVDVLKVVEEDVRCTEYLDRTEVFTIGDIRSIFTYCDAYVWAKDESGDFVLLGII